jgi:hypothetical protein
MAGIQRKMAPGAVSATSNLLKVACEGFESGRLSHDSFDSLYEQLHAEGRRRVDSLVFEHGLEKRLTEVCEAHGLTLSLGWYLSHDRVTGVRYWIKLGRSHADWNDADFTLAARLSTRSDGDRVMLAIFDDVQNVFLATSRSASGWSEWEDIRSLIAAATGCGPREVRKMDAATPAQIAPAVAYIASLGRHSRRAMSIRRRFVNGILSPYFHSDPTDIDALVLADGGRLTCVEFKRKYPARGDEKYFGLDEIPHVATMRLMTSLDIRMLHILLVAPHWNDRQSPVVWLRQTKNVSRWTWVAGSLDESALVKGVKLVTRGAKSGQRIGTRFQKAIDWQRLYELHRGLQMDDVACGHLAQMLRWTQPELSITSYQDLLARSVP